MPRSRSPPVSFVGRPKVGSYGGGVVVELFREPRPRVVKTPKIGWRAVAIRFALDALLVVSFVAPTPVIVAILAAAIVRAVAVAVGMAFSHAPIAIRRETMWAEKMYRGVWRNS